MKSLIFVLYLSCCFIVIFCFSCLILLFCYLCQSGVGLGFVVYLYFCGRGEKICCFDLFVNPPSNFIFLLLDLFWHYKRSSETEGVFNFKLIFIVFVYYSFSTCIRIFCKQYMYTFILHSIDYKKTRFSCLLIHTYLAHWLAIFSPIYNRPFFKFKENVW